MWKMSRKESVPPTVATFPQVPSPETSPYFSCLVPALQASLPFGRSEAAAGRE